MNNYADVLSALRANLSLQKRLGSNITDMEIILSQAMLMDAGSVTFKAMKSGELEAIFTGLVALAYSALEVLALEDKAPDGYSFEISNDYLMVEIMGKISQKIADCASGRAEDYSALFHYCAHLATDFINADFNGALRFYHAWRISQGNVTVTPERDKLPDLSDYLFE